MTSRQVFENSLIELNKVKAPTLILEDYNYFINKVIGQYINKVYNLYEISQQKTDDIRVLRASAILIPEISQLYNSHDLLSNTHEVLLPDDYLHILNCVVEYSILGRYKCNHQGNTVQFGAKKLSSDMWAQVINNYYFKPSYKNPYYYINNINTTNRYPVKDSQVIVSDTELKEKVSGNRYGNKSRVRMEIRSGNHPSFRMNKIYVDYIKSPEFIRLTQEQLDSVVDNSQLLEFPDYVCQEILNDLVKLLLENGSNPRLQTNIPVNQSIMNPQQTK